MGVSTPLFGLPWRPMVPAVPREIRSVRCQDVDADRALLSAKARHLLGWWRTAHGGAMPPRRTFDVTEHVRIIRNLTLVRVLPGGEFKFELQGEAVTDLLGRTDTGRTISLDDAADADRRRAEHYRLIVEDRRCRSCTGLIERDDEPCLQIEAVDCPLSDDGVTVSAIIGLVDRI